MGLRRWMKCRRWRKLAIALAVGGGGGLTWFNFVADPKPIPDPVPVVETIDAINNIYSVYKIYVNYK